MRYDRNRFRHVNMEKRVGNGLVIMAVTAAAISSAVALGITKTQQAQFAALNSASKAIKANQQALNAADILRATGYDSLGAQSATKEALSGGLYKSVAIGEEKLDAQGQKYRECTVSIYDTNAAGAAPIAEYTVTRAKLGTLMYDLQYDAKYDTAGEKDRALTEWASKQLFVKHQPGQTVGSNVQPIYVDANGNAQALKYSFNLDTVNNSADYILVKNGNSVEVRDVSTLGCVIASCSTAASNGAKVATTAKTFKLQEGAMVGVTFTNPSTAYTTLNVNNTGAKPIRILDSLSVSSSGTITGSGSASASGRTDADAGSSSNRTVVGSNYTDNTGTVYRPKSEAGTKGFFNTTYFTTTTFRTDTYANFSHFYDLTGSVSLSGSGKLTTDTTTSGYAFALFVYDGTYWNLVGNAYGRTIGNTLSGSIQQGGSISTTFASHFAGNTTKRETVSGPGNLGSKKSNDSWYGDYGDYYDYYDYRDCGCGSCFAKGSMVLCVDDKGRYFEMPIEEIKIGQKIVGANGVINTVKALYNPEYGLKLGNRKLMSVEFNGRRAVFSDEHEFYIKRGDKTFWATHCPESLEEENHVCENGRAFIDNKYEEICKLQGVDYWTALPKNRTTEFDPLLFVIDGTEEEYYMYDGKYHTCKAEVVLEKGADINYPLYHILVDGNCSYFVNGFLVCCREFAADVDWFTYVEEKELVAVKEAGLCA